MGCIYSMREATREDAVSIASLLREDDLREVQAVGFTAGRSVWRSFRRSIVPVGVGYVDGEIAAIWGLGGGLLGGKGIPWLLTAPPVEKIPVAMVKEGRKLVAGMLEVRPHLENFVDARYDRAIKFLRLLGFELDAPGPFGPDGALFRRFWKDA